MAYGLWPVWGWPMAYKKMGLVYTGLWPMSQPIADGPMGLAHGL